MFDGRSDDVAFIRVGIPGGGLCTGAERVKTPQQAAISGGTAVPDKGKVLGHEAIRDRACAS